MVIKLFYFFSDSEGNLPNNKDKGDDDDLVSSDSSDDEGNIFQAFMIQTSCFIYIMSRHAFFDG